MLPGSVGRTGRVSRTGCLRMQPMLQTAVQASLLPQACIIVSGMHRSGTSATARVVNLLGADIARELMPAIPGNNDRGFWESKAVHDIHESLLKALGSAWDDPLPLPDQWLESEVARQAKRALAQVVTKDFAGSRLFVAKDPRLSRLLPLWLDLLDELKIEPVVVVSVRNPLEVAASLERRDRLPRAKSLLMYLRHALDIELASRARRRLFVRYDDLLADWRRFAGKLEALVASRLPDPSTANGEEIERFLTVDLYRNRAGREAPADASDVPAAVIELFDAMSAAAETGDEAALRETCDRIRPQVAEATQMFRGFLPRGDTAARQLTVADFISPASFWFPEHLCDSGWIEHTPFACWLLDAHRPATLVELGTHRGFSFFTFCQAVAALGLATKCVAIDTWRGDDHAGHYGEEVFEAVRAYNESRYSAFATLVRSTFDAAAPAFAQGSIDLLHVDGRHFYEDVRHDFDAWRPKLSRRGIVLFHDTNVHERGFGVHRVWAELRKDYPHFEFPHGNGLGVLAVGEQIGERVQALFDAGADRDLQRHVRDAYARLGAAVNERLDRLNAHKLLAIKDQHIAMHVAHIAAQTEALARLEREAAAASDVDAAQRTQLEAQQERLAAQQERLAAQQERLEAQSADLDAIVRSTSWRVTRPLRLTGNALPLLVRRLRRGLAGVSSMGRRD
jgi:hypothetical protein